MKFIAILVAQLLLITGSGMAQETARVPGDLQLTNSKSAPADANAEVNRWMEAFCRNLDLEFSAESQRCEAPENPVPETLVPTNPYGGTRKLAQEPARQ